MIIQTNASDQTTELTVKDPLVGSSTAKGPVDLICQQNLRLQSQILDINSHTKYILRRASFHMTPHNTLSLSLSLSLFSYHLVNTYVFSVLKFLSLCVSLSGLASRRSWRPMLSGDLLWGPSRLKTSPTCRNSKVCENTEVSLGFLWIVFCTNKREKIKRQRILLQL